ncbi:MAG: histidine-type phosphatase [Muribaculum sp.]|nr:histidine-type phosphatase [Muribaculaceae bacterium]MCM1080890.1 histidine-type phosphatase [Muribaculum sp.]
MNLLKTTILVACLAPAAVASALLPPPNGHESVNQYLVYPYLYEPAPQLTPAPVGYKPFHMEHYGRHGSRWQIGASNYTYPAAELKKAHEAGKLTPLGESIYEFVDSVNRLSTRRDGELTDVGALEHRGIAQRMIKNFPEIFAEGTNVDARSSVVVRCIISMINELNELKAACPELNIKSDASWADMYYIVPGNDPEAAKVIEHGKKTELAELRKRTMNNGAYVPKLFNDVVYATDSLNTQKLAEALIALLGGAQNHLGWPWLLETVFTPEETYAEWVRGNAFWAVEALNIKTNGGHGPYQRRATLRNMIESADTAIVSPRISANMRFGHDGIVLPLAVLMELDDLGQPFDSLTQLPGRFHDYKVIPKGSNIQMVFYRPDGSVSPDDVLVKVMLNENETRLPVKPSSAGHPYYRWSDLRKFYTEKIAKYEASLTKTPDNEGK